MTTLYVVRHAIAGDPDPQRWPDDALRPLTPKGIRRFRKAAKGLSRITEPVGLVLSSPRTRTWQTAEILSEVAGWARPMRSDAVGDGSIPDVLAAIRDYGRRDSLALVGHAPSVSLFVAALLPGHPMLEFKKGAVARLTLDDIDAEELTASLDWLLQPRALRNLAKGS